MNKTFSITLRVLGVLFVLGAVAYGAYRLGYGQGVAQSPAIAAAWESWREDDDAAAVPYGYPGFAGPMMHGYRPWGMPGRAGFNPIGKLIGFLFFAFLFVGLLRFIFFRRMWAHGPWHGPWQGHWHGPTPPWAQQPPAAAPQSQPEPPAENK